MAEDVAVRRLSAAFANIVVVVAVIWWAHLWPLYGPVLPLLRTQTPVHVLRKVSSEHSTPSPHSDDITHADPVSSPHVPATHRRPSPHAHVVFAVPQADSGVVAVDRGAMVSIVAAAAVASHTTGSTTQRTTSTSHRRRTHRRNFRRRRPRLQWLRRTRPASTVRSRDPCRRTTPRAPPSSVPGTRPCRRTDSSPDRSGCRTFGYWSRFW